MIWLRSFLFTALLFLSILPYSLAVGLLSLALATLAGLLLALVAIVQMRQAGTTVIPHLDADALVTNGVFSRSRNPIYLGDALVLAGLIIYFSYSFRRSRLNGGSRGEGS